MLTHYFTALLVTGITHLLLAAFVLFKNPKRRINQTYALYSISISIWSIFEAFGITAKNEAIALFLWRLNHMGVIFIPVGFVHFVYASTNVTGRKRKLIFISYLIAFLCVVLNCTKLLILEVVPKFSFSYFINPGYVYYIFFSMWVLWAVYGLFELFKAYYKSYGAKRNQLKYFCWSMFIAYIGGVPNFFPTFNLEIPILMPFGTYLISVYAFATVYAIMAHRLMDINVAITRGIAYSSITAIIAAVYIGLMVVMDKVFGNAPGYNPILAYSSLFIVVLLALIYVLPQMKIRAIEITRHTLFRGKYDYQRELGEATRAIPTMLNKSELADYILTKIRDIMMIDKLSLFIYDEAEHSYATLSSFGLNKDKLKLMKIGENSALAGLLRDSGRPLVKEELERQGTVPQEAGKIAVEQLSSLGADLCIPLMIKEDLTGILTLSNKRTKEMYAEEDLALLTAIANQVALTIEYSKAIDKISSEKRYVGLGKASMRMAHDIRNPLVPLKTFLQILPDKYPKQFAQMSKIDPEFTGRFYESALEGVDRINLLIERALHYARHPQPQFGQVKLEDILNDVLTQEDSELKESKIKLQKEYADSANSLDADGEQLMELFSNLIGNSIDAMEEVSAKRLIVKTEVLNGQVLIEIRDTGCGIPKDKLDTIFDPFITYKHKGSGLGLAIVKKIVDDHKGTVEVSSEPNKGTTFTITLPEKQG